MIWGHQDLDKLQSGKQTKNKICGYRSPSAGTSGLKIMQINESMVLESPSFLAMLLSKCKNWNNYMDALDLGKKI